MGEILGGDRRPISYVACSGPSVLPYLVLNGRFVLIVDYSGARRTAIELSRGSFDSPIRGLHSLRIGSDLGIALAWIVLVAVRGRVMRAKRVDSSRGWRS